MLFSGLPALVEYPEGLEDRENLRVEDLLVVPQVEPSPCPSLLHRLPRAGCSDSAAVEPGAVRPDGVLPGLDPVLSRIEGLTLTSYKACSAPYSIVPCTKDMESVLADPGGTPYWLTVRRNLSPAWRALPILRRRFSPSVRAESSQMPNHLVSSGGNWTVLPPTRMPRWVRRCLLLREESMASALFGASRGPMPSADGPGHPRMGWHP